MQNNARPGIMYFDQYFKRHIQQPALRLESMLYISALKIPPVITGTVNLIHRNKIRCLSEVFLKFAHLIRKDVWSRYTLREI